MSKTKHEGSLPFDSDKRITVAFDGGRISSDAGLALLLSPNSDHGYRQPYFIDNVLYYTGCRIAETAFLTTKDVDLKSREIKIRAKTLRVPVWNRRRKLIETREVKWSPKSYEERIIPIDPRLLPILKEFEARRIDNLYGLYCLTERGCQISDHVSRHLKAVTGKQDVSVHTFRHTHISHALNRWGRLPSVVQKMVGHKKLETTQLYVHVSTEDLHREALKTG